MAKQQLKDKDGFLREPEQEMPLTRGNFVAMAIAGIMIVAGFLLMLGGGSTADAFNADIFSTRRIVVGPAIAFLGFVAMGAAIIIDPDRFKKLCRKHKS